MNDILEKGYVDYYYDLGLYYTNQSKKVLEDHEKYKKSGELHNIYRKIILPKEVQLIQELAAKNKFNDIYFALYHILLYKGFLSSNKEFNYGVDTNMINTEKGLSINSGMGVCSNISCHYNDLLQLLLPNQSSYIVGTKLPTNKLTDEEIINNPYYLNHSEVFVHNKSGIYIYDPTNYTVKKISEICKGDIREVLDFRLNLEEGEFIRDPNKRLEFLKKFKAISENIDKALKIPYPDSELKELYNFSNNLINKNINIVNNFHSEINPTYQKIKKLIPEHKNN